MESFRTQVPIKPAPFQISHRNQLLLMGSCFSENIGQKLQRYKFTSLINPFGILYNPVSIATALQRILPPSPLFSREDLIEQQGIWYSWAHHGAFSASDPEDALEKMNIPLQEAAQNSATVSRIILTLGTATVYALQDSGTIVANCHKAPAQTFRKRRLTVEETVAALYPTLLAWKNQHPELKIILTVSPVRHLRDGFIENQRSKAVLLLACEQLESMLADCCCYFPAYEIVMDELRDYRFFADDMIHPANRSIEYLWQQFSTAFMDAPTQELNNRLENLHRAIEHRPFHPNSATHQQFVKTQLDAIARLQTDFPWLALNAERTILETQQQG
ncbi:MAG: GSCFA domain-containing protein [Lewinellaceae bacterium]|nr:GSCFA domain-containing protein [Lewinellaceae bacterium]